MIIKITGGIITVFASFLFGLYYAYRPYYRKNDLESLITALEMLENEIKNYSSLVEAFLKISGGLTETVFSEIFLTLHNVLKEKTGEDIEKMWSDCINGERNRLYLKEEDFDKIFSFGRILKSTDREMELKNIALLKKYLSSKAEEINTEYIKNKRMFQSVGLLGGLMIVIALI